MDSNNSIPLKDNIINTLQILTKNNENAVFEIRILKAGRDGTISGYFNSWEKAAESITGYDSKYNIYVTLNSVNPALLARSDNKLKVRAETTTNDNDVINRQWLLIDSDAVRPAGISSTSTEKKASADRLKQVIDFLTKQGWPEPVICDSGNGWHGLYAVDLPNTKEVTEAIKGFLQYLAMVFDDENVQIDQKVFNAARITKLYGTMVVKGENTADRPHRRSKRYKVPETLTNITFEQVKRIAAMLPKKDPIRSNSEFDIQAWIQTNRIAVRRTVSCSDGTRYILEECPFDSAHGKDSAIFVYNNGAIGFSCFHNGCQGKTWQDLRQMLEPGCYDNQYAPVVDSLQSKKKEQVQKEEVKDWPEPEPIESELVPVVKMPVEIIPEPFRPWLEDISNRMQCPIDFVVIGAMVVCAAIVGAGCAIRPKHKDDWEVIPNLWGGIVARPSQLKSPTLAEILKSIAQMEAEYKTLYDEEMNMYEVEFEAFKAQKEAVKSEMVSAAKGKGEARMEDLKLKMTQTSEPKLPSRRRFKTNDTTIEKLGELLNENERGLLVFRDELVGLLCSWEREDRQQDRTFYLEGWNGNQGFTVDRIGRGTIDTKNICISILGGIQPAKLTGYLLQSTANLANDGMIQRFQLLVYPDEPQSWKLVDRYPNKEAKLKAYDVIKRLANLDYLSTGATTDNSRPYFNFSEEAQKIFYEWLTELEGKIKSEENPLIGEHLAKYRSLMPSMAVLIHLIDVVDSNCPGAVSSEAAIKAAAWCDYLESHAKRIYGLFGDIRQKSAAELVKKIKQGTIKSGFTQRDIYRNEWHLLNREQTNDACQELCEAGWLRMFTQETAGKSREEFVINPKVLV